MVHNNRKFEANILLLNSQQPDAIEETEREWFVAGVGLEKTVPVRRQETG